LAQYCRPKVKLERVKNWELHATRYFNTVSVTPFYWGRHDCALFVADAVHAMTGIDFAAKWRGSYCDEAGAAEVLAGIGAASVVDLPDRFGLPQIREGDPRRGDVVAIVGRFGPVLGVQWAPWPVSAGDRGLEHAVGWRRLMAWRVG
jgi:hypothetical protein